MYMCVCVFEVCECGVCVYVCVCVLRWFVMVCFKKGMFEICASFLNVWKMKQ